MDAKTQAAYELDTMLVHVADQVKSTPSEVSDLLAEFAPEDAALILILKQMRREQQRTA